MRADRLLSLMLLLQAHKGLSARQLAGRLGVSPRTIYRDLDALSIAGIPVYCRPGVNGGIFLDEHYRLSLTGLTRSEVRSLFTPSGSGPLQALGLQDASTSLVLKLLAALPSILQEEAHLVRQRIYIDNEGWFDPTDSTPSLHVLQQAVWEDRIVSMQYQHADGIVVNRVVAAYSLVAKAGMWYLVGRTLEEPPEFRTYRVARILSVELTDQKYQRLPGFDLPSYWEEHWRSFARPMISDRCPYSLLVRLQPDVLLGFVRDISGSYSRIEQTDPGGWITIRAVFPSYYSAQMRVLSLCPNIEVLEPSALRQEIAGILAASLRQYQNG